MIKSKKNSNLNKKRIKINLLPGLKKVTSSHKEKEFTLSKENAKKLYLHTHKLLFRLKKKVQNKKKFSIKSILKLLPLFIKFLKNNDLILIEALRQKRYYSWFVAHSINVMIFAQKIGIGLNFNNKKLYALSLSCLLHDLGMLKIPDYIKFKPEDLTTSERMEIEKHPIYGKEMASHLNKKYPYVVKTIYHEHELYNGEGYPQGLSEDDICSFARIVTLADKFDALIHERKYRERLKKSVAYQEILQLEGEELDPKIVKAFIQEFTIFPIGIQVILNTGEIAEVLSTNESKPLRPTVKILTDSTRNKLDSIYKINLAEEPLVYISKTNE